jgi:hypothetical protein
MEPVQVSTYVSHDIANVRYQAGEFAGARLQAVTRSEAGGNTIVCVPEAGVSDQALKLHSDIVARVLEHRMEMIRVLVAAVKPG